MESKAGRWRHASSYRYLGGWQLGTTVIMFLPTRYSGDQGFSRQRHATAVVGTTAKAALGSPDGMLWTPNGMRRGICVPAACTCMYAVSVALRLDVSYDMPLAPGAGELPRAMWLVGITALPHQSACHTLVPARSGIRPTPPAWLLPRRGWVELLALFIPYHKMARTPECVTVKLDHTGI